MSRIVVIGAGQAGAALVVKLRNLDDQCSIDLIGKEDALSLGALSRFGRPRRTRGARWGRGGAGARPPAATVVIFVVSVAHAQEAATCSASSLSVPVLKNVRKSQ